jgi:hypothetical protein
LSRFDTHDWIHPISVVFHRSELTPALEQVTSALHDWLLSAGCTIQPEPSDETDLIITSVVYGTPVDQEDALFLHAKRKYQLAHRPAVLTIIDIPEAEYQKWLDHFSTLAAQEEVDSFQYPGMAPRAVEVLQGQAQRGGPEVATGRLLQTYVKSFRVMALRSDQQGNPLYAVHFDLAGAHPTTPVSDLETFAEEVGLRILAATCTEQVSNHVYAPEPLPRDVWEQLPTPDAMIRAGSRFTEFGFFTAPVSIDHLLGYTPINKAVSAQYSEGCYAAFDPEVGGLISTATGSARLVDKRSIDREDQAIIVGIKPERDGAIVRPVEGMPPVVPSVEAVEMMTICEAVSTHAYINSQGEEVQVPNIGAILHGHLGVASYDPEKVECVTFSPPYYRHLVSCGTRALAEGSAAAFSRAVALCEFDDPRAVVFLEQPGHGVVIVEKPVEGKQPFDTIHEYLQEGHLQMTLEVPQEEVAWQSNGYDRVEKVLRELAHSQR